MPTRSGVDIEDGVRRRLEPLLRMYPAAIADIRASGDRALRPLEDDLVKLSRYVAGVVAQLNGQLPLE